MAISRSQINAIKDFGLRTILLGMLDQHLVVGQALGINVLEPTNSPQQPASAPPAVPTVSVSGSNGIFTVAIEAPKESINKTVYYEVSYSVKSNFTGPVTTLPPTTSRFATIPSPGTTAYFRARASYDQHNWSAYAYA
jgi:hypothetical protein